MILGHNFPAVRESVLKACEKGLSFGCATEIEVEMAEFICERIPHVEMVRMVNSGTEAVMSAIRTGKRISQEEIRSSNLQDAITDTAMPLLVKCRFWCDDKRCSRTVQEFRQGCTRDTMTAVYNDLDSVRASP